MDPDEHLRRADVVRLVEGRRAVVAGPGAGKTTLLVDRLVHLLDDGVPARSILTLVFNRRAAGELRRRLAAARPDRGLVELRVATFHSFSLSVVDRFWRRTTLAGRPALLPAAEQRSVVRTLLARAPDPDGWDVPEAVRTSASFGRNVADALLRAQEQGAAPADLAASDPPLARLLDRYLGLLAGRARVDHAGVLATAAVLTADPAVRDALGVEHVLVDEFQDVNRVQELLVEQLATSARSLVLVGDPEQAIYGFRGATSAALSRAATRLGATEVRLTTGFRCAQPILDAAGLLTASPALVGRPAPGGVAAAAFAHRSDELQWIADHVRRLALTTPWGEIAVLCRSLRTLRGPVTRALQRNGIPYRVHGARTGVPVPWVALLLDLLDVVARTPGRAPTGALDPLEVLEAAAGSPLVGGDPLASRAAFRAARRHPDPEMVLATWAEAQEDAPLAALLDAVAAARRSAVAGDDVATVAWALWSGLPARARLEAAVATARRSDDLAGGRAVGAWHDSLVRYVERNPGAASLADHLATLDGEDDDDPWAATAEDATPAVQVLTVHQAKGLEFDHVIVPALEEGRFPVVARPSGHGTAAQRAGAAAAEERRLLYVALTRARSTVTLTATLGTEDRAEATPSRFFSDLAPRLVAPDDLVPAPSPGDHLLAVATSADARRTWGSVLRDPETEPVERAVAAAGLRALAGGGALELPWIPQPDLDPLRMLRTTPWSLSASAVATYLACGRRFLYERVLRLAPWQEHPHAAFGTAVHAAVSAWMLAGEHPDRDLLERRLEGAFTDIAEPAMPLAVQREAFRRRLPQVGASVVDRLLPDLGEILQVEQDLAVDGPEGVRLIARPDLVTDAGDGGVEITDWKSGSSKGRDASGDVQLAVYHHVVSAALGRPVRRLRLAYVVGGTWGDQPVDDGHEEACAALVETAAAGVVGEHFPVGDDPPCRSCAAHVLCDAQPRGQDLPW